jgi:hypothetical protein
MKNEDMISNNNNDNNNSSKIEEYIKESLSMQSNYELIFNAIKQQKENEAKIRMVKEIEKINELKRNNKYFDNSISSDLYNKVTEAVNEITDNLIENDNDNYTNTKKDNINNSNKTKGMQLKKKIMVDNIMEMRENTIKLRIFFKYYLY